MTIDPPFRTEHLDSFRRPPGIDANERRENSDCEIAAIDAGHVVEHTDDVSG